VCNISYGRIQGRAALISHFQNSSLMHEDKRCRPVLFVSEGPDAGEPEPFPMGVHVRPRAGSAAAAAAAAAAGGGGSSSGGLAAHLASAADRSPHGSSGPGSLGGSLPASRHGSGAALATPTAGADASAGGAAAGSEAAFAAAPPGL
jgi:protein phosphatase 1 regulatory subunit 42